jgi:voltage-gated potassium channel
MITKEEIRSELSNPKTKLGQRYMSLLIVTIIFSIFYLFVQEEYPDAFQLGSTQLFVIEFFIFVAFSVDFLLRLFTLKPSKEEYFFLAIDLAAIIPSIVVMLYYAGMISNSDLEFLALLRLFRLARIIKLLRMQNTIMEIFGTSVLTLIFGIMTIHLGVRVLVLEFSSLFDINIYEFLDQRILMIAVTAVGSVFGIALAITFGIAKQKQIEISELHRSALDALEAFEADIKRMPDAENWKGSEHWRNDIHRFLNEEISYEEMKTHTKSMLQNIRDVTFSRPSLDVPFHTNLVEKTTAFLTKTQIEFHPVFYIWLNRIAQLYFVLVMLAAPGLTGLLVQLLVIFVFQGLVVIIYDMDHAVDTKVALFNSKILKI